jgi:hypothetical protein
MSRNWLPPILFLCSALLSCWAQADMASAVEGGIAGNILREDGQLANGAKVCTSIRSGNNTSISCGASVDTEARFTIEPLKPGTYQVFAINDAEDTP